MREDIVLDYKMSFALRRSWVRRKVLSYLASVHPRASYPQEIARRIGARSGDVLGALKGAEGRYRPKFSLIELGLVKVVKSDSWPNKLYAITELGMEVLGRIGEAEGFSAALNP